MSDHGLLVIRWVWTAIFSGFGIFLMMRGSWSSSARRAFCRLRIVDGEAAQARLEEAMSRRVIAEGKPAPLGYWMGGTSIALGAAAAFTSVPIGLLYALLCFAIAGISAVTFLQLRNSYSTRVAFLSVREPEDVIPAVWFFLGMVLALCSLAYLARPAWALASATVCLSSALTLFIAWRLTHLGAILSGQDLVAERIVDERIRFYRSSNAVMLAYAQPFIFVSQMYEDAGTLHWAAYGITGCAFLAFVVWMLRRQRSAVKLNEAYT